MLLTVKMFNIMLQCATILHFGRFRNFWIPLTWCRLLKTQQKYCESHIANSPNCSMGLCVLLFPVAKHWCEDPNVIHDQPLTTQIPKNLESSTIRECVTTGMYHSVTTNQWKAFTPTDWFGQPDDRNEFWWVSIITNILYKIRIFPCLSVALSSVLNWKQMTILVHTGLKNMSLRHYLASVLFVRFWRRRCCDIQGMWYSSIRHV